MKENKKITPELKRKLLFFPIVIILIASFLYFTLWYDKEEKIVINNGFDYDLPQGEQKELPDTKTKVIEQFNSFEKEKSKNKTSQFNSMFDDLVYKENIKGEKKDTPTVIKKIDAVKRIQEQLRTQEKVQQKNILKQNRNYNHTPNPQTTQKNENKKSTIGDTGESYEQFKARINEENQAFFSNKNNTNNINNNQVEGLYSDNEMQVAIDGNQTVTNLDRVTLRFNQRATIKGIVYKKNTMFYGFTKFSQNRVFIQVNNIKGNPVNLHVYDGQDFDRGIYTSVNFKNIASSEANKNVIDEIESNSSIVNSAKKIFSREKKKDKLILINNYRLLLKAK